MASSRSLGPLEVSVHLASLQALTKVIGNWARVKTWHANLLQNGAWPLPFQKTRGGRKGKKNKKSFTGCLLQEVKDIYGLQRGLQLNISQANGMGPILEPCAPTLKPA